jgi:hypothetical protein
MTETNVHPEIAEVDWIDDAFYIKETRYGLFISIKKNGDSFLTGATYDGVLEVSRWHLKCEQDGTLEKYTRVVGDAFVSGKL